MELATEPPARSTVHQADRDSPSPAESESDSPAGWASHGDWKSDSESDAAAATGPARRGHCHDSDASLAGLTVTAGQAAQ